RYHLLKQSIKGPGLRASSSRQVNAGLTSEPSTPNRNLYGSRTAIGQHLLRLLLDAPDLNAATWGSPTSPTSPSERKSSLATATASAASAPATAAESTPKPTSCTALNPGTPDADAGLRASLDSVASLVQEVAALMTSHRDKALLLNAIDSCQARVNTARAGGSERRTGGPHSGGGGGGTAASSPHPPAKWASSSGCNITPGGHSSNNNTNNNSSSSGEINSTKSSRTVMGDGLSSGSHGYGSAYDCWDWRRVRHVVVVGLGSLGTYQAALRSGQQTERDSTRAASRLYQLALSLVLASPAVLPGLGEPLQQATSEIAVPTALSKIEADTAATATADAVVQEIAAQEAQAQVQYFDPEYLEWDVRLVRQLWWGTPHDGVSRRLPPGVGGVVEEQEEEGSTPECAQDEDGQRRGQRAAITIAAAAAPTVALVAHEPTLFYAPCCPREVYDMIVRHNLAVGTLRNVALVGNSLKAQADTAILMRAFGGGFGSSGCKPGATGSIGGGIGNGFSAAAGGSGMGLGRAGAEFNGDGQVECAEWEASGPLEHIVISTIDHHIAPSTVLPVFK
ncbi:hypothetical protein VOLCADRAFT_93714, partial [Volvox carteri f. nagariensis]